MQFSIQPAKKETKDTTLDEPVSGFGGNDDEPKPAADTFDQRKAAVNRSIKTQEAVYKERLADETAKILKENPTIYEYDSIYEKIKPDLRGNTGPGGKKEEKREAQYMASIIRENERRKREQLVMWERMEGKERERERALNGEQHEERFMTSSYMKFLNMRKKYEQIEAEEERFNKKHTSANATAGMMGFYSKMLTDNVAVGGGKRGEVLDPTGDQKKEHVDAVDKAEKKVDQREEAAAEVKRKAEEDKKLKEVPKERSRSRSKERAAEKKEEGKVEKPEEKGPSKEEKLKAMRERYKARKANPAPLPSADDF